MAASDVAEGHGRAQRNAAAWIIAAHDARHIVASGIEARNDPPALVDDLRIRIGAKAREGPEIARHDLYRIEGTALDGTDTGIWLLVRIAEIAVIGGAAALELLILTL